MKKYSKIALFKSKGRIYKESLSKYRTPFQRDRDRIIHSASFRRLKHKTQVFVNTEGDHYRTRITHSIEVAQIARSISRYLGLNEDLSETLSLAHDLGHTPFGHAGEEELNLCMKNYGGFDHNIQTVRIVTIIEKKYYEFDGLNLSLETLDGLIKHNGIVKNKIKYDLILGKNFFKKNIDFNKGPSLEAQIASISDDIAYNSHDLEDGLKAKLFNLDDLKDIPILNKIVEKHNKKIKKGKIELVLRQIIREIINVMVKDIINNTKKNLIKQKIKNIKGIFNSKTPIVCFSKKMKKFDVYIKQFLMKNMYYSSDVLKKTNKGKKIINRLFKEINKNSKKYLKKNELLNENKEGAVCDYIAGMTDRYAINLYNSIK